MDEFAAGTTADLLDETDGPIAVADWGARSAVGLVRPANEDSWGESGGRRFVVADGMGGIKGGAHASAQAVAGFLGADAGRGWHTAMGELNTLVRKRCDAEGFPGAGTTLVGLVVEDHRCVVVHIGDSRIYRLRDGELRLVTADHSLAQLRIAEGLDPYGPDPRGGPRALTAFLGNRLPDQQLDVSTISARPGDRVLLCSDGVSEQVDHLTLGRLLERGSCNDAASHLVSAADDAGGEDNATALVVELGIAP